MKKHSLKKKRYNFKSYGKEKRPDGLNANILNGGVCVEEIGTGIMRPLYAIYAEHDWSHVRDNYEGAVCWFWVNENSRVTEVEVDEEGERFNISGLTAEKLNSKYSGEYNKPFREIIVNETYQTGEIIVHSDGELNHRVDEEETPIAIEDLEFQIAYLEFTDIETAAVHQFKAMTEAVADEYIVGENYDIFDDLII